MIADSVNRLTANWWTFLVRALVAFAIAVWAFASPGTMATGLVYLLAAYFIITGVMSVFAGFSFAGTGHWWALILVGVLEAFLGVYMLTTPGVGPLALAYIVALWSIATGLLELTAAIQFRSVVPNDFWWGLLGVLTVAIGVYIIYNPGLGVLALVYTIGVYAVLAGIALTALAFRIKSAGSQIVKQLSTV